MCRTATALYVAPMPLGEVTHVRTLALTLILGTLIATAACHTATIYNATGVPLTTASNSKVATLEGVTNGILAAGKS